MPTKRHVTRRRFIQHSLTAGAVGATAPIFVPSGVLAGSGRPGANDRIAVGLIGAGGMGRGNLNNCAVHKDVVVTGVCDVWEERRDLVLKKYRTAKPYADYREMLQRDDIDAVIIATPPHWHCLMAVEACRAGKDIYLQKPMSIHVGESLAIRRAVERHERISQIGTQIHAGQNYRRVVEYIRSGKLGKINVVRTFNVMNQGPQGLGKTANGAPPKGLDWDRWVGPAEKCSYDPFITLSAYHNCSFMQFSGGWTPGMAPHIIDLPYWALELGAPTRTSCSGGRYLVRDSGDAPDTQEVLWEYPDFTMAWSMSLVNSFAFDFGRGTPARRLGIYFHGANGTLYANYDKYEVVPEGDFLQDPTPPEESLKQSAGHEREWLDCIKSRTQPSCHAGYHYRIDLAINLANLSMKLGRDIRYDPKSDRIVGDPEAVRLARPVYRDPWKFPAEYL